MAATRGEASVWLAQAFAEACRAALEAMVGTPVSADTVPLGMPAVPAPDAARWSQAFTFGADCAADVLASRAAWEAVGRWVLAAAGVEAIEEDARSTYQELLGQALSSLAQTCGERLGREGACASGLPELSGTALQWASVTVRCQGETATLTVGWSKGLLDAVTRTMAEPARADAMPGTFDLLLDVEMPVSVSFGRAELPLKDVLKLASGAIVELNRAVSEPVEIIVNNCVIARGEVVVVDGNYGVRITQIVSRQERLRSLR